MELIKITDLTRMLGISSRSLRYYEQAGLINSVRPGNDKYRYYDGANIERLKQIMVLRKMQIPIKDVFRIYQSEDMSVVVQTFVNRIKSIEDEVDALNELKDVTNEFLRAMLDNGVTKISALPILYEQMEKQLSTPGKRKATGYAELTDISERLAKPVDISVINLPAMRVLSSFLKSNPQTSDTEGFCHWMQSKGISQGEPGRHEHFEFQTEAGDVIILRVADSFANDSVYRDYTFEGGLFAVSNVYLDEDLGGRFRSLIAGFDDNNYYELDYASESGMRHPAMVEPLISPDEKRELVALYVPIKKRLSNPALFTGHVEIDGISLEEIEKQNPILWEEDVSLNKLTPIFDPYFRINEQGEAEYIAWITPRVLSTNVEVALPFRVDVEFRIQGENMQYGWGTDEGSIRMYHGYDLNYVFGINIGNNPDESLSREAICFHQPIFRDYFNYPKRGAIKKGEYNRLTWIVGLKHLAVIINNDVRFCGTGFPYMSVGSDNWKPYPIILGSNGQSRVFFKSIRVSQLKRAQNIKIKEGELTVVTKRSNNIIPTIHRLITNHYGENYWFNGCAKYVMEALGEPDYDYWFFSGLTGDNLAQVYSYNEYMGEAVSACMFNCEGGVYLEKIFEKCGYASTFVSDKQISANKEMYVQTLMAYIDKGVPVIAVTSCGPPWAVYVGYEEYGQILLYLTGEKTEPERVSLEHAITDDAVSPIITKGWLFMGEKKRQIELAEIYRNVIMDIPSLFATKTKEYCLGPEAFRIWGENIENGKFDGVKPEEFDGWGEHVSNVCNMATNGSCLTFLERAQELNPDLTFLEDIRKLYWRTANIWNNDNGNDLEALGGGFNVTPETLQDKDKRVKIAKKLYEAAECMEKVLGILNNKTHNVDNMRTVRYGI